MFFRIKYISFTQFTEEEGGYIICRLKNTIFVFDQNLNNEYGNFEVDENLLLFFLTFLQI